MRNRLAFELVGVLYIGVPALLALLAVSALQLRRRIASRRRRAALVALRGFGLLTALVLLARPVVFSAETAHDRRTVAVLLDRSRSMALAEDGATRYRRAISWTQDVLAPAVAHQGLRIESFVFDAAATPLPLSMAEQGTPDGSRTDLAGAILTAVQSRDPAPAAVIALSDGAANRADANQAALLALLESRTPFVGIGFGRDTGVPSLSLRRLAAPTRVAPRRSFRVSAVLESSGAPAPDFDLILLRDGALAQTKRVVSDRVTAGRLWTESFDVVESEEGLHQYTVQLRAPQSHDLVSVNTRSTAPVRVGNEKDFRVLFVQGALTWDFKFINRALRGDPTLRVTGLSRTSKQSVFRQNVESAGELSAGFPTEIAELAPYRVLVLSELKPADLTPAQQDLAARFCGELGGGVLLIGGPATFDQSWQGSRLEQLLPVTFDSRGGVGGLDRPFHLRLTPEARANPVFTLANDGSSQRIWDTLPTFSGYGRVLREKPGSIVWVRHSDDSGPDGKRILIASQRYGAGLATVIAIQNLWRWRLAKDAEPQTFDRFWQQLFHFMGQAGSDDFQIQLLDQELRTQAEIRAVVEKSPRPEHATSGRGMGDLAVLPLLRVRDPKGKILVDQKAKIEPSKSIEIRFRAEEPGIYTILVEDQHGVALASRGIEILDVDREMERTGRDLETLRQWAAVSQGFAIGAEELHDPRELAAKIKERLASVRTTPLKPRPVGINGAVLGWLLACLAGEWILRKRWDLR
jgi:hypothetical protein